MAAAAAAAAAEALVAIGAAAPALDLANIDIAVLLLFATDEVLCGAADGMRRAVTGGACSLVAKGVGGVPAAGACGAIDPREPLLWWSNPP